MIQLNLLPDVKLEYIKAQKLRSLVMSVSFIVTAAAVVILILMLLFDFAQKAHISSLKSSITSYSNTLKDKPNINTILTVQNQLKSLGSLYSARPAAARLFDTYLNEVTPEAVSLNQLAIDFTQNTMVLTGTADSLTTVNQFVDTLKLTTYSEQSSKDSLPAFTNVVLSSFGVDSQAQKANQAASFTINLNFDPTIFNAGDTINLNIPNITVSHYEQQDSAGLFQAAPVTNTSTSGGH